MESRQVLGGQGFGAVQELTRAWVCGADLGLLGVGQREGVQDEQLIDLATVIWVKGAEFWVAFDTPKVKVAERITRVISMLIKT